MKNCIVAVILASAVVILLAIVRQKAQAQNSSSQPLDHTGIMLSNDGATSNQGNPLVFVTEIPPGYRDWKLISVSHEEGRLTDIRAILGNDIAVQAYREGTFPFPDGAIITRIAWSYVPSEENNKIFFGVLQQDVQHSFVAGAPTNGVQFMIKDSKKYATTGGWGYGQFNDGKPIGGAMLQTCFPCHQDIKSRDFVFTRYAP